MDIKTSLINLIKKQVKLKEIKLEIPPSSELGDYAFPCFELAKKYKKSPTKIASDLSQKFKSSIIKEVKANGPYVNFFIDQEIIVKQTIKQILEQKNKYGSSNLGKNKKILLEHTSINPNASPHVGRARNAILGDSISNILKFQKHKVETHYFVNDVGKQIALLVLALKGTPKFEELLNIYIKIHKNINAKTEKQAFELLNKFEKGDKQVQKKFKKTVDICLKGQLKILKELGISYDKFDYESDYLKKQKVNQLLKQLEKTGQVFEDEFNRKVLNQDNFNLASAMKNPVLVLTRKDGTSLYPLRDITYNLDKIRQSKLNLVVLGEDQKLYHRQISAALELLKKKAPKAIHYSFILLTNGKMSTRKGNLVLLSDFINEATEKAKQEILKRDPKTKAVDKLAKSIANAAIKYSILKISPKKNVIFDLESSLSFEGDTGPYLQYTCARASSILKRAKKAGKTDYSSLKTPEEIELIKTLSNFTDIVKKASSNYRPHLIAVYLYELSKQFNEFYHKYSVIKSDKKTRNALIDLTKAVKQVLENGLNLLGIDALNSM